MEGSNLKRKEYDTVMSLEANDNGLEQLLKFSSTVVFKKYFDKFTNATSKVAPYLAYPCVRTKLQMRLGWCMMGFKRSEYETSNVSRSKERELEPMEALRVLNAKDDSAIAWAKRKDAFVL